MNDNAIIYLNLHMINYTKYIKINAAYSDRNFKQFVIAIRLSVYGPCSAAGLNYHGDKNIISKHNRLALCSQIIWLQGRLKALTYLSNRSQHHSHDQLNQDTIAWFRQSDWQHLQLANLCWHIPFTAACILQLLLVTWWTDDKARLQP